MLKKIFKWLAIIMGILILLAGFAFAALIYTMHYAPFRGDRFNKQSWQSTTADQIDRGCPRGSVYADLKSNYLMKGISKHEVVELLGAPRNGDLPECIGYDLGMCSGLGIDYDVLNVCFDEQEKLTKVFHVQH